MAILNDLAVDVAFVRDLCYGNSVTVLEVLRELHEVQLRHCLISVPQSEEEIGDSPSCLYLRNRTSHCNGRTMPRNPTQRSVIADVGAEDTEVDAGTQSTSASGIDPPVQHTPRRGPPSDEEVCCRFRIFDMKDVLYLLDEELKKAERDGEPMSGQQSSKLKAREPFRSVQTVLTSSAWQVANISGRNNYKPVWADSTLKEIIASFQKYSRVPIFQWNAEKNLLVFRVIFSATDLFKMLCRYFTITGTPHSRSDKDTVYDADPTSSSTSDIDKSRELATSDIKSLEAIESLDKPDGSTPLLIRALVRKTQEIKLQDSVWFKTNGKKTPLCVSEHESIRSMIRFIAETGYSAIPLMTDDQTPVGVISTSDFRLMMLDLASGLADEKSGEGNMVADVLQSTAGSPKDAEREDQSLTSDPFQKPIISYLSRVKRRECFKTRYPVISSRADSTVMQIVHRLAKAQIHRILIMADSRDDHPESPNRGGTKIASLFSRTDFGKVLAALLVDIDAGLSHAQTDPD